MAARLEGPDARVELVRGKLGEIRVSVDGEDAYVGPRLWYPRLRTILDAVRESVATAGR